jgi:hypothetical protein
VALRGCRKLRDLMMVEVAGRAALYKQRPVQID